MSDRHRSDGTQGAASIYDRAVEWTTIGLVALMLVVGAMQVVARYVLNSSLIWSEELLRYAFVWATLTGAAIGVRRGSHVSLGMLEAYLPPRAATWLGRFNAAIVAAFALSLTAIGVHFVTLIYGLGQRTAALDWPMWAVHAGIPAGFLCLAIEAARRTRQPCDRVDRTGSPQ